MISIITATYNRAKTLKRLYESLNRQSNDDFEWLIIDDDSNDDTEKAVRSFSNVGKGIRYFKQNRGGKHRAINYGVKESNGNYVFIVDSDDMLTDDAIETIHNWIEKVDSEYICGVAGLRNDINNGIVDNNNLIDKELGYIEASNLDRKKYNLEGDKAEVYKKSILQKYPFPEFDGELFITEAVVWDRIAMDGYKLRWYNKPIYICEYRDDGLTKSGANSWEGKLKNPRGFMLYAKIFIQTREEYECYQMIKSYNNICRYLKIIYKDRAKYLEIKKDKYTKMLLKSYFI